ncbi:MAG: sigma-70 family RNA polymerase sigma factor [Verrucomicrobia bacterium]|nr:sigma-70 family RNA polymerase sigma factor [Verrucomicrobiota bacterium]
MLAAADLASPSARAALEKLCRTYWYPLYAYVRRRGHRPEDAQDLTQEFFVRLLQKNSFAGADRAKGRFRSFLLGALQHFLADEHDRASAKKRGGGQQFISWEQDFAEKRFAEEPTDELSPDKIFERRWALTVLEQAASRLRAEYQAAGTGQLFEHLKGYVTGEGAAPTYAATAAQLGLSESAVKSAIFRLRRRYYELVREAVAQTVADPRELEEEIRHLMAVFSSPAATF